MRNEESLDESSVRCWTFFVLTLLLLFAGAYLYFQHSSSSVFTFPSSFDLLPEPSVASPLFLTVNSSALRGTDLERISPRITGPRTETPHRRGLLTIPIGKKSVDIVNGTIYNFLNSGAGRVLLFAYDKFDWSTQSWYNDERVILIRHLKQMKWWFIKRFVTPLTVEAYDYLWLSDDDASFAWNPHEFMDILDKFKVELAQPSHLLTSPCVGSSWAITHRRRPGGEGGGEHGRWTNFVECGPLVIIHKNAWKRCLWNFLQDDLTSGYGLDEMWYDACKPRTAVIDKLSMCHNSTQTARSNSKDVYDPWLEWPEYQRRFPNVKKARNQPYSNLLGRF